MAKFKAWLSSWKAYIVAYIAFFVVFWFVGSSAVRLTPAAAYFGVLALHAVFFFGVWVVRNVISR